MSLLRLRKQCYIEEELQKNMNLKTDKITKAVALLAFAAFHENSVERAKKQTISIRRPFTDKKLSFSTLMQQVTPVLMEK